MKNNMGVKRVFWGEWWRQFFGKQGWILNNGQYSSEKKKKETDGQFFGKSQLKLSTSILLFTESPSCMETLELMSISTVYYSSSFAQSLNMFLLRSMKTLNIGGGQKNIPVWAFYNRCNNTACAEYSVW